MFHLSIRRMFDLFNNRNNNKMIYLNLSLNIYCKETFFDKFLMFTVPPTVCVCVYVFK